MPELPEVDTTRPGLRPLALEKAIRSITVHKIVASIHFISK